MNSEIIGKLTSNEELLGTCFLISRRYIITAYHVIKDCTDIEVEFELIGISRKVNKLYFLDENILELDNEIEEEINYMTIGTVTSVEKGELWETSGYPYHGVVDDELNIYEYQYASGEINRYVIKEIPDLELTIKNQKDLTDWEGVSGAPLIVNNQISGVIVVQRLSPQVQPVLKAISMEKIIEFLKDETEVLKILSFRNKNLLNDRIDAFTQECKDKFFSFEYTGESFASKCLILKPQYAVEHVAEMIDLFLKDYANSLQEIIDTQNSEESKKEK